MRRIVRQRNSDVRFAHGYGSAHEYSAHEYMEMPVNQYCKTMNAAVGL